MFKQWRPRSIYKPLPLTGFIIILYCTPYPKAFQRANRIVDTIGSTIFCGNSTVRWINILYLRPLKHFVANILHSIFCMKRTTTLECQRPIIQFDSYSFLCLEMINNAIGQPNDINYSENKIKTIIFNQSAIQETDYKHQCNRRINQPSACRSKSLIFHRIISFSGSPPLSPLTHASGHGGGLSW